MLGSANDGGLKGVLDDLKRLVETHDGDSRLREHFPVRDAVCKLVIDNVQSCIPSEAVGLGPACEVGHLAPTNVQCGASPSLVVHVVKMIKDADDDRKYVAVDRVLRGSLTSHQRVGVIVSSEKLPPSIVDQHNAIKPAFPPRIPVSAPYLDSTLERTMVSIGQVGSLDGNRFMEAPDGVTTGSVCAICGLDDDLLCLRTYHVFRICCELSHCWFVQWFAQISEHGLHKTWKKSSGLSWSRVASTSLSLVQRRTSTAASSRWKRLPTASYNST